MDKQKINCTVETCKFNNLNNQECLLKQITVTPTVNCNTQTPDESMCSNYENDNLLVNKNLLINRRKL